MTQTWASMSISAHVALKTSPDLAAVKIRNSRARAWNGFRIAKLREEIRQITVRHGRVMPAGKFLPLRQDQRQMTAPCSRVFPDRRPLAFA